jgi:hypothetical protein
MTIKSFVLPKTAFGMSAVVAVTNLAKNNITDWYNGAFKHKSYYVTQWLQIRSAERLAIHFQFDISANALEIRVMKEIRQSPNCIVWCAVDSTIFCLVCSNLEILLCAGDDNGDGMWSIYWCLIYNLILQLKLC